jgi:hypothetical protein
MMKSKGLDFAGESLLFIMKKHTSRFVPVLARFHHHFGFIKLPSNLLLKSQSDWTPCWPCLHPAETHHP